MPSDFIALRQLEDHRVKMRFDDGIEVIARLNSVTQDFDESRHLVYDHVEWASDPQVFKNDAGKGINILATPSRSLCITKNCASG